MQLYKTTKAPTENCKPRDLWVTDFAFMPNNNKIAFSYTSKEISKNLFIYQNKIIILFQVIFDMTSKLELNLSYRIIGMNATPYCLDYW
jgi:hypothetical protein